MRLIDADALRDAIIEKEKQLDRKFQPFSSGMYNFLRKLVDDAPAINPADLVPKGHWIDGADSFGAKRGEFRVCSFCDVCIPTCDNIVPPYMWVWCPKCGSFMRERADEDIGPYRENGGEEDG